MTPRERKMAIGARAINLAMLSALRFLKDVDSLSVAPPELLLWRIKSTLRSALPKALNRYKAGEVDMDEIMGQIERIGINVAMVYSDSSVGAKAQALKSQIECQETRLADTRARVVAQEAVLCDLRARFACLSKSVTDRMK